MFAEIAVQSSKEMRKSASVGAMEVTKSGLREGRERLGERNKIQSEGSPMKVAWTLYEREDGPGQLWDRVGKVCGSEEIGLRNIEKD